MLGIEKYFKASIDSDIVYKGNFLLFPFLAVANSPKLEKLLVIVMQVIFLFCIKRKVFSETTLLLNIQRLKKLRWFYVFTYRVYFVFIYTDKNVNIHSFIYCIWIYIFMWIIYLRNIQDVTFLKINSTKILRLQRIAIK